MLIILRAILHNIVDTFKGNASNGLEYCHHRCPCDCHSHPSAYAKDHICCEKCLLCGSYIALYAIDEHYLKCHRVNRLKLNQILVQT
jgi:hypothetical protein